MQGLRSRSRHRQVGVSGACAYDAAGQGVIRRQLRRRRVLAFCRVFIHEIAEDDLRAWASCTIGRASLRRSATVRLMPPGSKAEGRTTKGSQIISGDKAKTQTYCDSVKLASQIEEADENKARELTQKMRELEKTGSGI